MLYNTIRSSQTLGEYITASSITADTVKNKKKTRYRQRKCIKAIELRL